LFKSVPGIVWQTHLAKYAADDQQYEGRRCD